VRRCDCLDRCDYSGVKRKSRVDKEMRLGGLSPLLAVAMWILYMARISPMRPGRFAFAVQPGLPITSLKIRATDSIRTSG
jgi:hypothetical protein